LAATDYLIAGNWKMNGTAAEATALAAGVAAGGAPAGAELLVCPPSVHIAAAGAALAGSAVGLGGQDCHEEASGAFTGDVSAEMLVDLGCTYVILGHSERRDGHGESDALVWRKANAAHRAGLAAIVCVGETEQERLSGLAEETVSKQVKGSAPDAATPETLAIAYEPVWAIGSGRTPTLEEIAAVHAAIRRALVEALGEARGVGVRILYGGSVKPGNAKEILALDEVHGALIGGASLKAEDFLAIAAACGG